MQENELAGVLWVRAIEEIDAEGDLLRQRTRDRATLEARAECGEASEPEAFLLARASRVLETLAESRPALAHVHEAIRWLPPLWAFATAGAAAGLAAEGLGSARVVNLLAVPLVGLVAWNLALYALGALRTLGYP